jgi:signal transduction histidine kinase/ligand-binding sensor domain-containing protein
MAGKRSKEIRRGAKSAPRAVASLASRIGRFCQPRSLPLALLIIAVITSPILSGQDLPIDDTLEVSKAKQDEKKEKIPDPSTLNLQRWGAVTIFHGLPSDRINAIAEDANGLLCFGTDNGLVRYDGKNVETMSWANALFSRRILSLKLDARGGLWIGTDSGAILLRDDRIDVMDETRGQEITSIAVSEQNEVAVVTAQGEIFGYTESGHDELSSGRANRRQLTRQSTKPLLNSPRERNGALTLSSALFSDSGELLIGSSGRGVLINRGGELLQAAGRAPRPYFISSLYRDGRRIYLGEQASRQTGGLWSLKNGRLSKSTSKIGAVTALDGGSGELWVGTNTRGVYLFKLEDEEPKQIEHLTFENTAGGLRSNHISTIYRDREGIIWFGTDRGVCRYDPDSFVTANVSDNPQSNFIRALSRTSSGGIFAGTNNGLFRYASDSNGMHSWAETGQLQGLRVYALLEDHMGAIWAGTSNGLFVKPNTISNHFQPIQEPSSDLGDQGDQGDQGGRGNLKSQISNLKSPDSVRAIAEFRSRIYAAFFGRGIERIEKSEAGIKSTLVWGDTAARQVICFAVDGDKALWFGTTTGELRRFDGLQTTTHLTKGSVHALSPDSGNSQQRIWIGTSQGLYLLDGKETRELISGVNVLALLVTRDASAGEESEVVWCATQNAGLIKLIPDKNISIRFDTEQGLASQKVFALAPERTGILIGTNRGVVRHRPSSAEPRLQIKRLVADRTYSPDYLTAELSLPHTQRNILLEVKGLGSRTYPSQFQYEFILQTRTGRELKRVREREPQFSLEGLEPGGYRIEARAISRDLVYSAPQDLRFRIRRAPPPWTTLLLTSLLGIAVAAATWAFRQQLRLTRANRTLEETNDELHETRSRLVNETEAERSRIARDLHDQTLADLRHLLVLTDQLPATHHDESSTPPALLRRKIEAISNEIRHICEDLSPSMLENIGFLPALEWALSDAVTHLPAEEKFTYKFSCEHDLEDRLHLSHTEQIQVYRIVQEVLNNICRHAKAKEVRMTVRTEDAHDLVIEIEDDGVGFDGTRTNEAGHGIANIRTRANLIGAHVNWHTANPGCRFELKKVRSVK